MDIAALSMGLSQMQTLKKEDFINNNNYKNSNQIIKVLIDSLVKIFEEKCTEEFYPKWRGNEGNTKVFVFKLYKKLTSKYGNRRENVITVRVRMNYLDIEVYNGVYCNGEEFSYSQNTDNRDLIKVYKDINDLFNNNLLLAWQSTRRDGSSGWQGDGVIDNIS